jgi:hypothetical protein
LALVAAACGRDDGPTTLDRDLIVPVSGPLAQFNDAGQCFGDDAVEFSDLVDGMSSTSSPQDVGCNSNDIDIAIAIVGGVSGIPNYEPGDPVQCTPGGTITLDMTAVLVQNANSAREDIGVWIGTAQPSAISGQCNHYFLEDGLAGTFNDDEDSCSGMAVGASANLPLGQVTVPCTAVTIDPPGDLQGLGTYLQVGACVAWKVPGANNTSPECPNDAADDGDPAGPDDFRAGTLLANKAKCNCEPFFIPLIIPGSITIVKDAVPNDAQDFSFTTTGDGMTPSPFALDDDANVTLSNSQQFNNLTPGGAARTVTEGATAGWTLSNIVCSGATESTVQIGADADFDAGDNTVSIVVAAGENVSCTFTNTAGSSLDVEKQTIGGTASFDYTVLGGGLAPFSRNTAGANPTTTAPFTFTGANAVETKYVTETALAGYVLTDIQCTLGGAVITYGTGQGGAFTQNTTAGFDAGDNTIKVELTAGDNPSCTFVNSAGSSLDIEKQTLGGTASFDYTVNGGGLAPFSRSTAANNPSQNAAFVFTGADAVGTKYVTETALAGWTLTNITCSAGGAVITIGTGQGGAFSQGTSAGFDAGDNTVKVELTAGDNPSCTFENSKDATVDIEKISLGGTGTFEFVETGSCFSGLSRTTTTAGVATTTDPGACPAPFPNDQYVQETAPAGWALTLISCSGTATIVIGSGGSGAFVQGTTTGYDAGDNTVKITNSAGSTAACTFTNTKLGSITIVKDVQNPATDPEDFTFTATGTGTTSPFDLDDDGETTILSNQKVFSDLLPGTRTFTEGVEANWDLTGRSCTGQTASVISTAVARQISVNLAAGEDVVCTFVNQRLARLIVQKVLTGGGTQSFDFTRNPGADNFSLTDGGERNSGFTLAPDTYRVCELDLAVTWSASATIDAVAATLINPDSPLDNGNRCVDVLLAYGDSKTVVWTNNPPPGGDARTIGYWKNWSSCTGGKQFEKATAPGGFGFDKTLDGNLPQTIGDFVIEECEEAVFVLSKQDQNGKNQGGDAAYLLAAQLLGAELNVSAGVVPCTAAANAIADGQILLGSTGGVLSDGTVVSAGDAAGFTGSGTYWKGGKNAATLRAKALEIAGILDSFNNNTLCP